MAVLFPTQVHDSEAAEGTVNPQGEDFFPAEHSLTRKPGRRSVALSQMGVNRPGKDKQRYALQPRGYLWEGQHGKAPPWSD